MFVSFHPLFIWMFSCEFDAFLQNRRLQTKSNKEVYIKNYAAILKEKKDYSSHFMDIDFFCSVFVLVSISWSLKYCESSIKPPPPFSGEEIN